MSRFKAVLSFFFLAIVLTALSCGSEEAPRTPVPTIAPTALPTSTSVPTPTAVPVPISDTVSTSGGTAMYLGGLTRTGEFDTKPAIKGQIKWKFKANPRMTSSPVLADGVVYFGASTYLYAVDAELGEQVWKFDTGGRVRSSPAVSGGLVYIGSNDGHLYALDTATGNERWKFETGGNVRTPPAVSDGTVYFGSQDFNVYALDAETGVERWRFAVEQPDPYPESIYHEFFDRVSGGQTYNDFLSSPNTLDDWNGIYYSPAIAEGLVVFGASDGYYYGVDAETGRQRWRTAVGELWDVKGDDTRNSWVGRDPTVSPPIIADGKVYIPDMSGFFAIGWQRNTELGGKRSLVTLDLESGQETRRQLVGCTFRECFGFQYVYGVAVSDEVAYVVSHLANKAIGQGRTVRQHRFIVTLDLRTNADLWEHRIDINPARFHAEPPWDELQEYVVPAIAGDLIYAGGPNGFRALLKDSGEPVWELKGNGGVRSSPIVHDGVVYFTALDGYLYAVE